MTHLSLFSGIGGIDLAAEWAGFTTVAFVEKDPFCQKVLAKHWPGVPIFDDVCTFDPSPYAGCDLVSGGFPCQDISTAGLGAGLDGKRSGLWFEMLRVVRNVRPLFVLAENVPALRTRGIDRVLDGLAEEGYTAGPFVVGAGNAGAPHLRRRVFVVGVDSHSDHARQGDRRARGYGDSQRIGAAPQPRRDNELARADSPVAVGCVAANFDRVRKLEQEGCQPHERRRLDDDTQEACFIPWRDCEPPIPGVVARVPRRVDRIRGLGNSVSPQQVYPILKAIAEQICSL